MSIAPPRPVTPQIPSPAAFRLGVVTGLRSEEAIVAEALSAAREGLPADSTSVACAGPGADRAQRAAERMIADGVRALLSFGFAGGCDPALPPGTAVLATGIRDLAGDGETLWTNVDWRRRLKSALLGAVLVEEAAIGTTDVPVTGTTAKQTLFWSDGIAAIDMESAGIARAATDAHVPFMALRVVLDGAGMSLPRAALAGVTPDGETPAGPVLRALLRRPQDAPGLLALARAHRTASDALARAAAAAGPQFAAI